MVCAPRDLAIAQIQRGESAANSKFAAAHSDVDFVFRDKRRHREGFAAIDVGDLGAPDGLSGFRVNGNGFTVESVENELAVREHDTAIDDVAARNSLRGGFG